MKAHFLSSLILASASSFCFAETVGTSADWEYLIDTGIGSKVRGAIAYSHSGDVTIGFSCYTENNKAWLTAQFQGDIKRHEDKSYIMQIRTDLFNSTWEGLAYAVDETTVQIEATSSAGSNEIDIAMLLTTKLMAPFQVLITEIDGPKVGETFRYTVGHEGAAEAITAMREACGHRTYTGSNLGD